MRYFYTDPLAAAWMAKHFGMKFKMQCAEAELSCTLLSPLHNHDDGEGLLYYIQPESLHILEQQKDDLCIGLDEPVIYVQPISELTEEEKQQRKAPKTTVFIGEIIQRGGVAFMWPEIENPKKVGTSTDSSK